MSQKPNKFNRFKVNSILEVGRHEVLWYIFARGTPSKSDATPLDQYLTNLPAHSTANFPRVSSEESDFYQNQLEKIHNDPTCTTFDITLLCKAIWLGCEKVANFRDRVWRHKSDRYHNNHPFTPSTEMEFCITAIKNIRNKYAHDDYPQEITCDQLLSTAATLRQLFHNALCAAGRKYRRSRAEINSKIQKVNYDINEIIKEVLGKEDLMTFHCPDLKENLIKETNETLKKHFEDSCNIDPMSFLTGIKLHLQVQKVFTEIKVTRGRVRGERQSVRYQDLVKAARSGPRPVQPQVLLVEGIAGSGKTTFVTLVTDEWLKDVKDRTITGLDYYDLLLRVQCRERTITSLNSLLEIEVSKVFLKFRDLVLPLIKNCRILILIDGLDEQNEDSEKLIDDILTQMKTVNGCTLLFTSRPEGVTGFISRIPREYQVSYIELIGIPQSHRELFVRRYHEEIMQQTGNTQDTEKLVENVRQVLEKEHFRLPLNMVFLTWVYIHDPSTITSTTTQTQLYHSTYQLCLQKLLDRLARHSATRSFVRQTLETCLKEPMEHVHYESLLALWCSQLTYKVKAVESIKASCTDHGIPYEELLSAFLTLKANRTHLGVIDEQYSAPHKGLQDFYAALFIANHHKLTTSSAGVRGVLKETLGKLDEKLDPLQNVLYHVAGLLHLLPNTVSQTVTEEVVDMLHESGMRTRYQWLDLVEDTRANPVIVRRVAPYFADYDPTKFVFADNGDEEEIDEEEEEEEEEEIEEEDEEEKNEMEKRKKEKELEKGKEEENMEAMKPPFPKNIMPVEITDTYIESFISLLPCLPPCEIEIRFKKDPGPRVGDLLNAMHNHICTTLNLDHHYRLLDPTATSDQILQQVLPRSRLWQFHGHLTEDGIRLLPRSLRCISLVLTDDDHAARTLTALHSVWHQLPYLQDLKIHVPVAKVTPSSLISVLPGNKEQNVLVDLYLSGVNDHLVKNACRVAKALQCPGGYFGIKFPRASVSYKGWRELLEGLTEEGVRVQNGVGVMGNYEDEELVAQLDKLAIDKLLCKFITLNTSAW